MHIRRHIRRYKYSHCASRTISDKTFWSLLDTNQLDRSWPTNGTYCNENQHYTLTDAHSKQLRLKYSGLWSHVVQWRSSYTKRSRTKRWKPSFRICNSNNRLDESGYWHTYTNSSYAHSSNEWNNVEGGRGAVAPVEWNDGQSHDGSDS